jgi:glucosamine-6-phosphate deaminase
MTREDMGAGRWDTRDGRSRAEMSSGPARDSDRPARDLHVDELAVLVWPDGSAAAMAAARDSADALSRAIADRGEAVAMFAAGASHAEMLDLLLKGGQSSLGVAWRKVRVVQMDEYVGLPLGHPAALGTFIADHLTGRVALRGTCTIDPSPGLDPEEVARAHAACLGGLALDLCVVGIGDNGHLAFNEPSVADPEDPKRAKIVELEEATRRQQVARGWFPTIDDVPALGVTTTMPVLLSARNVVGLCAGARRSGLLGRMLLGAVTPRLPASLLRKVPGARLHLDEASASRLA